MDIEPKVGEVWWALEGTKVRPVLIMSDELSVMEIDINIARLTTSDPRNEFDIVIENWEYAGLSKPSCIRVSKLTFVHYLQCKTKIGELHPDDLKNVIVAVEEYYVKGLKKSFQKNNR